MLENQTTSVLRVLLIILGLNSDLSLWMFLHFACSIGTNKYMLMCGITEVIDDMY